MSNAIYYYSNEADALTTTASLGSSTTSYSVGHTDAIPAKFSLPLGTATDASGNIYVADSSNHRIRKITPSGVVTTFAGSGSSGHADGTGTNASFSLPAAVATDPSGNVYVADYGNNSIRKITSGGVVTTLAGDPAQGSGSTDGIGTNASFNGPQGIVFDGVSNSLYISDTLNAIIRKLYLVDGSVVTYGQGGTDFSWTTPVGIAVDSTGNVYVVDEGTYVIVEISTGEVNTIIAGTTGSPGFDDGNGTAAKFSNPIYIAIDPSGNMFISDNANSAIRKIDTSLNVTTWAIGSGISGPQGIAIDASGNLYVSDGNTNVIMKVGGSGSPITNFAGSSVGFQDGGGPAPTLAYSSWRIASNSTGSSSQTLVYNNGTSLAGSGIYYLYPSAPCFLEGSTILCLVNGVETYVPVEQLRKGSLVKTSRDGYKAVELVGKGTIENLGSDERTENRLYRCSTAKYPELTADLFITGCHSVLVDTITDEQKEGLVKQLGRIFITDKKYRLTACVDERAEPWQSEGTYNIWHFALEHSDIYMNYGVYANGGLLVETSSIRFMRDRSNMTFL